MASFHKYKLSDGTTQWRVAYRKHDGKQGNRRGFRTKREAQAWWTINAARLSSEAQGTPPLSHYWPRVLQRHADWKKSTLVVRERAYKNHVEPRWGDLEAKDVRAGDVQDWIWDDIAPLFEADTSVQACLTVLRLILAEARRDGHIDYDPTTDVIVRASKEKTNPTDDDVVDDIITWDQVQLLMQCVDDYEPYKDIIALLATTGMRWGEAAGLRPGDIDLDGGRIRVARTVSYIGQGHDPVRLPKSGHARTVAFPPSLRPVLERRIAATSSPDDWLFPSRRTGEYMRSVGRTGWFGRAVDKARKIDPTIPAGFHAHSLRHTAVSRWIDQGVPMSVVAHQVGHAHTSTTERVYAHLMPDSLDRISNLDPGIE